MNRGRSIFNVSVLLSMVFLWSSVGSAGVIEEVTSYFKPASGALIAIHGDDYLINMDASSGVMVGDLLSIVTPGEKLVDPASGAILGSLDTVKGVLKVTKVRSGFSHARPLGAILAAQKGDSVRRYQNLTAIFRDQQGTGLRLYGQLVSDLPGLEWQGAHTVRKTIDTPSESPDERAQLTFLLNDKTLIVSDSEGQVLRSFPVVDHLPAVSDVPVYPPTQPISSSKLITDPGSQSAVAWDPLLQNNHAQVAYAADYPGFLTLGEFPGIVMMADFASAGGQLFVAGSDGSDLNVFGIKERMEPVASEKNQNQGKIHAVAWWLPEVAGPLYLAVTASSIKGSSSSITAETIFTSSVYRFSDGHLTPLANNLPYMLGTFDRDGDGNKEALLGQRFDLETIYGPVRELKLENGSLDDTEPTFELPLNFPVQGSLFADLTGDGKAETIYTRKGILYVISNGRLQYESTRQMGGSLSRLTYDVNPGQADALFTSIAFEVPQVAADIDGDGQLELIAVSTDSSAFSAPGLVPGGGESWLSVIKYQKGRFVKGTLGEKLENPIQGLTVNKRNALVVLSRQDSILGRQGQSHLLALPLAP